VTSLTLPGAQAAFDTLSGEAHASAAGAMLEGHALYGQTVTRRLAERREAVGAQRLQGGAWARGYGMGSELDGDGNAHGARLELYGLAVGVDAWASESWLIGASVNTLKLDADFRAGDGAEADAKNVSLYTSVQGERGYLDAVASFAWWNSEVQRRIAVGSLAREARSNYGMDRIALALEAGLTYDLGNSTLQPLLSVEFNKLSTEGFREDGADEVNLIGRSQDVERTVAGAGVRWTGEFSAGTWTFAPTAQARWLHTFGDLDAEFDVAFAGAPDTSFRVRGVTVPEDRGLVGIGLQASRDTLDVFADVDYQAGDGFKSASFGAGLRWRW
jgi:outer membrane autotransporter protein